MVTYTRSKQTQHKQVTHRSNKIPSKDTYLLTIVVTVSLEAFEIINFSLY